MAQDFKVGDIVVLKSGGPPMTVQTVPSSGRGDLQCSWFAGKKHESAWFAPESLMYLPDDEGKE